MILSNEKEIIKYSFKFDFPCSNNEAEYKALGLGLLECIKKGIKNISIKGNNNLVVKQING